MAQMDKTHEPATDLLHLSAGLLADGIRASYARWVRVKEVVPFFFNFIDYLVLSLPESTGIVVAAGDSSGLPRISTMYPTMVNVDVSDCEPIWLSDTGPVLWLDAPEHDKPAVVSCVQGVLTQFHERSRKRLGKMLCKAIARITAGRQGARAESPMLCPRGADAHAESSEKTIEEIVQHTQRHLAYAIAPGDEAQVFFIRKHACDETLDSFSYRHDSGTPIPCPPSISSEWVDKMRNDVDLVFHTGFVRLKALDADTMVLCVPCHFGGIPWLVVCRVIPNTRAGHWQAYTIYRDVIPRLNDALRRLGQNSVVLEMRRLFEGVVKDFHKDSDAIIADVQKAWKHLPCIYPLCRPVLKRCVLISDAYSNEDRLVLQLGGGTVEVAFEDEQSRCSHWTSGLQSVLESVKKEAWGTIDPRILRDAFLIPVMAEFRRQQAQRGTDLAASAYKIGHPMKDRADTVRKTINTLARDIKRGASKEKLIRRTTLAGRQLRRVWQLGHFLDMISRAVSTKSMGLTFLHKDAWHSDGSYLVFDKLLSFQDDINDSGSHRISLVHTLLDEGSVQVKPWIEGKDSAVRPADLFYDELFTEVLVNASRHGAIDAADTVAIEVSWADIEDTVDHQMRRCIVFSNRCDSSASGHGVQSILPHWQRWDASANAAVGGLIFIALALRETASGLLYAKADNRNGQMWFSIGLWLQGIPVE